ncbi:MAG: xanthine dehydrogenase family protein molybdopterin-binding subunit [Coprothermobacterota bacterium]|nr:xanthine dehydrogenase family protein molybdopterin-binding subunit [Coprothermobacterota bacterium]
MSADQDYKYIGKGISRLDGPEKVTGSAMFVHDMTLPGMLYGKMVKSPHACARIVSIDISEAEKSPGVRAVLVGRELPYKVGIYMIDKDILAKEVARYHGEPVVAIAAQSELAAEEACAKVKIVWEALPAVLDPREGLSPAAPLVHPELASYSYMKGVFQPQPGTNISHHQKIRKGDVEIALAKADVVWEAKFYNPPVQHVAMETHTCIAQALPGSQVQIWTSAQSPFTVRNLFSACFGIPHQNIRVHVPYVGGGFGGKAGIHLEPLAYLLSQKAGGRPVKLTMTREEEFGAMPSRQGLYSQFTTGATREGKIISLVAKYIWDAGAYADYGVNVGRAASYSGAGPYEIPNCHIDSLVVYTNKVFGTAYRGFGHLEALWGIERNMDIGARRLGLDPVEFRRRNVLRPGAKTITGETVTEHTGRVDLCLEKVAEEIGWNGIQTEEERAQAMAGGKVRGKGVALLHKAPAMPVFTSSAALLKFNENGSVDLLTSIIDYGQGTYTALAQAAAEELKMPIERIQVPWESDTAMTPYDWQTVASRGAFMGCKAVIAAARDALQQIKETASQVLRAPVEELVCRDEVVFVAHRPEECLSYREVVMGYSYPNGNSIGGPVIGRGHYIAQGLTHLDLETGQGLPALDWTYGAHGAEIEVDLDTGEITVLNLATALDVGQVLNAQSLRGQIIGGVVQGLGSALLEEFRFSPQGRLLNAGFVDYKIPTSKDLPRKMSQHIILTEQLDGPYGARGVAEHPMISVPGAIGNALYDALGIDFFELPLNAERVWLGIQRKRSETQDTLPGAIKLPRAIHLDKGGA